MKRIILLLVTLALFLASCESTVPFTPTEIRDIEINKGAEQIQTDLTNEERARKLAIQFANGNFSELYQNLSENLQGQVDISELRTSWNNFVSSYGYFVGYYGYSSIPINDYTAIKVFLIYEGRDVALSLKFDKNNTIDGLWLNSFIIPTDRTTEAYTERVVSIKYDVLPLDAILTTPRGVENPPVVLLTNDLGRYNYNGERGLSRNSLMRDIAQGLAEMGVASLRVNKRFYQYQELYKEESTLSEEVLLDVSAAIDYLKECRYVDGERIFYLGHGFSGNLAPKIALDNEELRGIISLGGSPRHLADVYFTQAMLLAENNENLTDTQRELNRQRHEEQVETIKTITQSDGLTHYSRYAAFWSELNNIDNSIIINYLTSLPILIMHAEEDIEFSDVEYQAWQEILRYHSNATFKSYSGLNHMFMPSSGLFTADEYNSPGSADIRAIADIAEFVLSIE